MTVIVDKKLTKKERDLILDKMVPEPRVFDAKKFFGKVELKDDPLKIQRSMRDE